MRSSLRLQLLAWLLVPLGFLVAVNTWLSFREASATATAVQDRMLLGAIRIIAEQTYYRAGELHVEVPPAALELFESASRDRVYYRVVSPRGALLLGYPELPSPARPLSSEEFTHFDATMRGEPVRVAALGHPLIGAPEPGVVVIEVAQTLRSHRELASQIWEQAIVHQLIMLALTIVMVWLGLRFGLRPLIRLRDAVLERRAGALEPLDPGPVPQELRDGVRDGIRLVNQLLTLFIAEAAAHSEPRQAEVDLAEVVKRVLEELAPSAQAKDIDLGFEQRGSAPVRGTPSMLHELVANLVDNGIRYAPRGGVVTAAIDASGDRVTLRIEDNGPGIPLEQRERVFERFYRLHDDGPGGSGLGLPIVREIATASRASVQLSDPARGSGLVVSVVFG